MHTDHHREARRSAIVRLLRSSSVRRQQELVRLLRREGHTATQSSISRDLRELGVLKHSEGYVLPDGAEIAARTQDNFVTVAQFVREIRTAGTSIIVLKTTSAPRRASPPPSTRPGGKRSSARCPATTRCSSPLRMRAPRRACSSCCAKLLESE